MARFCLLENPDNYVLYDWDLVEDTESQAYWLDHFVGQFDQTLKCAGDRYRADADGPERIQAAREHFGRILEHLRLHPDSLPGGKLGVIDVCRLREMVLRGHDIGDPFANLKGSENRIALGCYSKTLDGYGELSGREKWLALARGVFAGNLFDVGSTAGMDAPDVAPDFFKSVDKVKPRPWLVDGFDAFFEDASRSAGSWDKAVVFIDNAGSDFILGLMPFLKELASGGTSIVLAANELPSLNDLTAVETRMCLDELAALDTDIGVLVADNKFEVVSSGNDLPLIDLTNVSDALNTAASGADLVIVEGMGRGIESNFNTAFTTDAIHLAVLKDPQVAKHFGGGLFDCIFKYTRAD
ncbi:MAG: ARMT1-like domain-containing protein [Phycisphaerae bacterium]|nr:ARMT1-like domain-containing protein [Phycisphaerae bacterium]